MENKASEIFKITIKNAATGKKYKFITYNIEHVFNKDYYTIKLKDTSLEKVFCLKDEIDKLKQ